jgi:hypothetical protein
LSSGKAGCQGRLEKRHQYLGCFGKGTTFLAVGQFDAAHSAAGKGESQTTTNSLLFTVDTHELASTSNLKIAFVSGADAGANVLDQDFSTAASALLWFRDPVTLGAASDFTSNGLATIDVMLSMTSTGTASTFGSNVVLGNAPGGGRDYASKVLACLAVRIISGWRSDTTWFVYGCHLFMKSTKARNGAGRCFRPG